MRVGVARAGVDPGGTCSIRARAAQLDQYQCM